MPEELDPSASGAPAEEAASVAETTEPVAPQPEDETKRERDRRAAEGRRIAEAERRAAAAEQAAITAANKAAALEQRLAADDERAEKAYVATLSDGERAEYFARKAEKAAQPAPAQQVDPYARQRHMAGLLQQANEHFAQYGVEPLTLEDLPYRVLGARTVDDFVSGVNAYVSKAHPEVFKPDEETPVATSKKPGGESDIEKEVARRVKEEMAKLNGSTGASRPNAAPPAARAPASDSDETPDYQKQVFRPGMNTKGGAAAKRDEIRRIRDEAAQGLRR